MKKLNAYIIEKLKLNSGINIHSSINEPKNEDYEKLKKLNFNTIINSYDLQEEFPKNINTQERIWVALMQLTNSVPFIINDDIYSFPGNYGRTLLNNIKYNDRDIKDTFFQYDMQKDNVIKDKLPQLDEYYNKMIKSLLDIVDKNITYEIKDFIPDNYTNAAKEKNKKRNGIIILPLILTLSNKSVDAEIGILGNSYYFFSVNGKQEYTINSFAEKIKDKLI